MHSTILPAIHDPRAKLPQLECQQCVWEEYMRACDSRDYLDGRITLDQWAARCEAVRARITATNTIGACHA